MSATTSPRSPRVVSIDALRGLVMVVMALDHARDFFMFNAWGNDPTNLATTTPELFFTRWITHFCAPAFVFLAGTGAYFQKARGKSVEELSRFLWTRGVWLVIVEVTLVGFAWMFDPEVHTFFLQVIWAIGVSMIVLAGLIRLRLGAIAAIGFAIVCGHNALDGIAFTPGSWIDDVWGALHAQRFLSLGGGRHLVFFYPVLPWIGVMALGYVFGSLYDPAMPAARRRAWLVGIGAAAIAVFCALRTWNIYGDALTWGPQRNAIYSALSFLDTTKYPPSLLYLCMTLGPAMFLLRAIDRGVPAFARPIITYGRVPMFYYLVHLYALHAISTIAMFATGFTWSQISAEFGKPSLTPAGYGFNLAGVYLFWFATVVALYPLCRWYDRYKSAHREKWWLSYL